MAFDRGIGPRVTVAWHATRSHQGPPGTPASRSDIARSAAHGPSPPLHVLFRPTQLNTQTDLCQPSRTRQECRGRDRKLPDATGALQVRLRLRFFRLTLRLDKGAHRSRIGNSNLSGNGQRRFIGADLLPL